MADPTPHKATRGSPVYTSGTGKDLALTPDGIALVANLAGHRKGQDFIAMKLGITKSQFKKLLAKPDDNNPVRLAYEKGFAEHAEWHRKLAQRHAEKNAVAMMFYGKAYLGIRENDPQVDVKTENKIQITMSAPMSFGEMLHAHGQTEVADFRKHKSQSMVMPPIIQGGKAVPVQAALPPPPPRKPDVVDATFEEIPRVCSPQEIAFLKANGKFDSKIHLTEGEPE